MDSTRRQTFFIMLAALLTAILRTPLLLVHGRVVAEEGTVYFQQAWDSHFFTALLAPHQGYYSIFMNGVTLLAERLFPLEWLAVSLTSASLLVLLLTIYLAVTCELFPGRTRWLAAAIVLFIPSIEVWLTAEDMQFYFSACTALICLSSARNHRLIRSLTLFVAGLTGPVSCIFTAFFLWRAWRDRTSIATLQAAILTACSLVQGYVLLHTLRSGARALIAPAKALWFGPVLVLKVFSVAFFGRLGAFLAQRIVIHHGSLAVCLLFWALSLAAGYLFWRLAAIGGTPGKLCFLLALASLCFDYSAIGEPLDVIFIGAFRYIFTGSLLLWFIPLIAFARARQSGNQRHAKLAQYFLVLFLFWGMVDSVGYWTRFQHRMPEWDAQVAAWRRDPSSPIRVFPPSWPYPMRLHPR